MSEQGEEGFEEFEGETDPQVEYLQQLIKDNEFLQRENLLLDAYLSKVDFSKVGITAEDDGPKKKKGAKKGAKVETKKDAFNKLNDDEKNDLVGLEIELVQAEIEQLKKAGDKDIDDIRTLMEEVDMRIAETKKDTYEFKRDIIIGAENPRTGKILGEKMIRFMEEKLRQKDTTIEKLRLKNTTTKALIAKMEQQLVHKEEMGEVLHLVDFDQLKIENQQYMEKIEIRNNELLKLKLSTSRTVQVLNSLKSQLSELVQTGGHLRKMIVERNTEQQTFETNMVFVDEQKGKANKTLKTLKAEQEDVDNPCIMDYIRLKHEVADAEKQVHDWRRKIELLVMEKQRARAMLKNVAGLTANAAVSGNGAGMGMSLGATPTHGSNAQRSRSGVIPAASASHTRPRV